MKLYLAGPMTGMPDDNFPAFHAAAKWLRGQGHEAINPAENFDGHRNLPLETYLRRDLADVCTCEGVALLEGWEQSRHAPLEALVAVKAGLKLCLLRSAPLGFYLCYCSPTSFSGSPAMLAQMVADAELLAEHGVVRGSGRGASK